MATRRLRLALWQYRRSLKRQAIAQEGAAGHLIGLAGILANVGRPGTARRLVGIALHLRVKAICLTARANALNWCRTDRRGRSFPIRGARIWHAEDVRLRIRLAGRRSR
jgi:hypothetical protein